MPSRAKIPAAEPLESSMKKFLAFLLLGFALLAVGAPVAFAYDVICNTAGGGGQLACAGGDR
jgi:hypothetical protein